MLAISGMYKSGTTWLLTALSYHPEIIAFREFDLIRIFFDVTRIEAKGASIANRVERFLTRYPFCRESSEFAFLALSDLDEVIKKLYADFSDEFDQAEAALTQQYGKPSRTGKVDDEVIPLNGVLRFAVWSVGVNKLFAAFAHEDRGVPILLMLGTADGDVA